MGNIIQTTKQSCSRNSLTRFADSIAKKVDDTPVITFKSFKEYFKNPIEEMYFGNCSGYDNLKGQDISVVGTPYRNNVVYHFYAAILGGKTAINVDMVYQKVEHNGFKFKFNCYEDELLTNIKLSLIESDLMQGVKRS